MFSMLFKKLTICFLICFSCLIFLPSEANLKVQDYENKVFQEVSEDDFIDVVINEINARRGLRGLLPLAFDPIATNVAKDHAKNLIKNKYLSYCDHENKCPDERYTIAGGSGAVIEIIKGFEKDVGENSIKLTSLLAQYFVDSLTESEDDLKVIFSPYINNIGFGYAFDKNRFAGVVEFVTIGGDFDPININLTLGNKLHIEGKVKTPFKFKAVSVAYLDRYELENFKDESYSSFDIDYLKPYFPPQDYIAYSSTSKRNLVKIVQGIGLIGAIGASPFTGGASAILAPLFLHGLQSNPPREIPLKGGMKVNSKSEFTGDIPLDYYSMVGLYYVSVLAELQGLDYPITVSRRTVRVGN